eukprot:SAG22_NODE_620_length_8513_cov_3.934870_3_plen_438_part_00
MSSGTPEVGILYEKSAAGCAGASCRISFARVPIPMLKTTDVATVPTAAWKVIGYHTAKGDNEYNSSALAWKRYAWTKLTHLVNYGDVVDADMLAVAAEHEVVVLGNGCCPPGSKGCAACPRSWTRNATMLNNQVQRKLAIRGMVGFVVQHKLSGYNLDIEGNKNSTAVAVTSLACELKAALTAALGHGRDIVAFDGPMLPTCLHRPACNKTIPDVEDYVGRFDFEAIGKCVDIVLPMGYDLTGSAPDGGPAAANAPLPVLSEGIREYTEDVGVPASKIALLLPWYGYDMACRHPGTAGNLNGGGTGTVTLAGAAAGNNRNSSCRVQTPWAANNHELGFAQAWRRSQAALAASGALAESRGRDADGTPWFDDQNATGWRRRVYFDDPVSIAEKVAMCRSMGVGGVGAWTSDTLESLGGAPVAGRMWAALWPSGSGEEE